MTMTLDRVEVTEECLRWKQGRGWVYQLLIDFLGNRPRLSLITQWHQYMVTREGTLLTEGGRTLKDYLSNITPVEFIQLCEMEKKEYFRLFDSNQPAIPTLHECDYRSRIGKKNVDCMLDIRNRYANSGIVFNKLSLEQDDHISIELEYMAILGERMLDVRRLRTSQQILVDSQIQFLEQHIMKWIPSLADDLLNHAQTPMYRGLGVVLKEFIPYDMEMLMSWRASLE